MSWMVASSAASLDMLTFDVQPKISTPNSYIPHLSKLKGAPETDCLLFSLACQMPQWQQRNHLQFVYNEVWNFRLHTLIMNLISLDKLTAQSHVLKQNFEKTKKPNTTTHIYVFFPIITSVVQLFFCLDVLFSSFVWIPEPAKSFPDLRFVLL